MPYRRKFLGCALTVTGASLIAMGIVSRPPVTTVPEQIDVAGIERGGGPGSNLVQVTGGYLLTDQLMVTEKQFGSMATTVALASPAVAARLRELASERSSADGAGMLDGRSVDNNATSRTINTGLCLLVRFTEQWLVQHPDIEALIRSQSGPSPFEVRGGIYRVAPEIRDVFKEYFGKDAERPVYVVYADEDPSRPNRRKSALPVGATFVLIGTIALLRELLSGSAQRPVERPATADGGEGAAGGGAMPPPLPGQQLLGGRPLPDPLGDPLLLLRALGRWLLLLPLVILAVLAWVVWGPGGEGDDGQFIFWVSLFFGSLVIIPVWITFLILLPKRRANAFYLRSFRLDERTAPIRKAIAATLGRKFRLTGIRAPARRSWMITRFTLPGLFLLRQLSTRFMNLEAGPDWAARLWRSLADARAVFVDLHEVTLYVGFEIRLAAETVGFRRVLFIFPPSSTTAEWVAYLGHHVALSAEGVRELNIIPSPDVDAASVHEFRERVKLFAKRLPDAPAGLNWNTFKLVEPHLPPVDVDRRARRRGRVLFTFAIVISSLFVLLIFA